MKTSYFQFNSSSTPINNMLFEANIISIENQRDLVTTKLFKLLLRSTPLHKIILKCNTAKRTQPTPLAISEILVNCKNLEIPCLPLTYHPSTQAPWNFNTSLIDTSLKKFLKTETNPIIYRTAFLELKNIF